MTHFPTRYELLRLGMGQEVAARRAFIATRGGLSWPTKNFSASFSLLLVLLICWLKLTNYTTVIILGSLSACLLFQSNLAASINIVKIIAWARYCRGGSSSCKSWRGGSSSCRGRKMQANRMRRLLKTTLPRMQPPCSRLDSNRGSMMFAQNVQQRLTSTVVGEKSNDSNLVTRNLKFCQQCNVLTRWRPEPWLQSLTRRRQKGSMCRLAWLTMSNTSLTSFPFLRRFSK